MSNDSGDQLVEVGAPVLADLHNDFVHGTRQDNCRHQNTLTAVSDFHRQTSKFHSSALKFWGEKSKFQFGDYMSVFSRIGKTLDSKRDIIVHPDTVILYCKSTFLNLNIN